MLTFTQFLNEGRGFELGGSKYSSGFGRYTKDGKSISKEEYLKASSEYKNGKTQTHSTKKSSNSETKTFSDGSSYELTPTTTKINIMAGTRYKHKEEVSFELDNHKIAHEAYKLFKHEIDKGWTDDKLTKENVIKFAKNKVSSLTRGFIFQKDKETVLPGDVEEKLVDVVTSSIASYIDKNYDKIENDKTKIAGIDD